VGSAEQSNRVDSGFPASSDRIDMIEFEPFACSTSMPRVAHVGATTSIAFPHRALHFGRDRPRTEVPSLRGAWLIGGRELLFLELADQSVERLVDDSGNVTSSELVAQQLLRVAQLVVGLLAHGEVERKAA